MRTGRNQKSAIQFKAWVYSSLIFVVLVGFQNCGGYSPKKVEIKNAADFFSPEIEGQFNSDQQAAAVSDATETVDEAKVAEADDVEVEPASKEPASVEPDAKDSVSNEEDENDTKVTEPVAPKAPEKKTIAHSRIQFSLGTRTGAAQLHPLPPYNGWKHPTEVKLELANFTKAAAWIKLNVVIEKPNKTKYTIFSSGVSVAAGTRWGGRAPLKTYDLTGTHKVHVTMTHGSETVTETLPFAVTYNQYGQSLGYSTVAWFDPGSIMPGVYKRKINPNYKGDKGAIYEEQAKAVVRNMHKLGIRTVVFSYAEYGGVIYYDNTNSYVPEGKYNFFKVNGAFYNNPGLGQLHYQPKHWTEFVYPKAREGADILRAVIEQAGEVGMSVIVGLGRDGDDYIVNDIYRWTVTQAGKGGFYSENGNQYVSDLMMQWRLQRMYELEGYKAMDLLNKYGKYESFAGFYISHEAGDIISAIQHLYGPIANSLKHLSPSRLVVVGPHGSPDRLKGDRTSLMPAYIAGSNVDVLAWQDSVGVGHAPNKRTGKWSTTYNSLLTLPHLPTMFSKIRGWVNQANANPYRLGIKTLWSVSEVWEMDGTAYAGGSNYTGAFPAKWGRVYQQMNAVAGSVDAISFYEFSSAFQSRNDPFLLDGANPAPGGNCGWGAAGSRCWNYQRHAEDLLTCYASAIGVSGFYQTGSTCF